MIKLKITRGLWSLPCSVKRHFDDYKSGLRNKICAHRHVTIKAHCHSSNLVSVQFRHFYKCDLGAGVFCQVRPASYYLLTIPAY